MFLRIVALLSTAALVAGATAPAAASDRERAFFERIEGAWTGPGEIVAGKYKGTKFVCNFAGSTPEDKVGMSLDGGCRVGVFNQAMSAKVERSRSGFSGTFLDGAAGKGLDVIGGSVKGEYAVFAIHRNALTGAMRAQLSGKDMMNVTISVHVEEELVPVIGITLKRVDPKAVSALTQN
ncbi:hypothetical protein [Chelativorans sp. AA-79]|uniref:hypothetical protein n=1 Tax=Chelativorans sp. AA-79 TaxID=3028735 RepID=UPI0023F9B755|nr:hypothetical protein [Chelativorans sp. AA-79]WEX07421.1 hypothetical protein PVE73_14965 [Chelativorans sp. AA-79]